MLFCVHLSQQQLAVPTKVGWCSASKFNKSFSAHPLHLLHMEPSQHGKYKSNGVGTRKTCKFNVKKDFARLLLGTMEL